MIAQPEVYDDVCPVCDAWPVHLDSTGVCSECAKPREVASENDMALPVRELVRTNTKTGAVLRQGFAERGGVRLLQAARQRVAWCGTDNLAMDRKSASAAALTVTRLDEPFDLEHYHFEWSAIS